MEVSQFTTVEITKEELEYLLHPQLGSDVKVENFKTWPLTQPGENYGSTILAAEINVQQKDKKSTLHLVIKEVPPSEFLRFSFDTDVTFNKEAKAYQLVSVEYERLQKEKGVLRSKFVNVFPKFYGARTNKTGDTCLKADNTAVILLENLKLSGYHTGDRLKGLNLQHMELGVVQLARFHALSVALKLLKPKVFQETVLKACDRFSLGGITNDELRETWILSTVKDIGDISECLPYIEKIESALRENIMIMANPLPPVPREPFAAFIHNDFWVNNMMFKYRDSDVEFENPVDIKFVDFQLTLYSSPVSDLIFFLYSSAADGVIEKHCDSLIRLYHQNFMDCLTDLKCNTAAFSYSHFQEELSEAAPAELAHLLFMVKFITADKSKVPDLSNCDAAVMIQNNYGGKLFEKKIKFVVQEFVKRGWL
ncbi:uncharacterized protein [Periplaneta americana]|uniref:uncharacterized protein n=1 Tax=Periplaneta americana TaxID=6978 RepID=UPI0037E887AB